MQYLKQSTASQSVKLGPFKDSTDGDTDEVGLTIANTDILLSKNGGTMAAKNSGGGTHDAAGWYTITLDATDTNTVGRLQVSCHMAGALEVWMEFTVLEEAIYDALFGASATGLLPANVTQIGGDAQSATDLKDFADAGYDPATSKVEGVKLVDTTTTNTDMRGTDSAALASVCTEGRLAELDAANLPADVAAVKSDSAAILLDTGTDGVVVAAGSKTGYSLTATTGLGNQTANITGNLSGSVGSVSGSVGSVAGNVGGNVAGSVGSLAAQAKADVNAEVDSALADIHLDHLVSVAGTVGGGTPTAASFQTSLTEESLFWDDAVLTFVTGVLAGQSKVIIGYNNTNGIVNFDENWTQAPSGGDAFIIHASHIHTQSQVASAVFDIATALHSTAGTFGKLLIDVLADTDELQTDDIPTLLADIPTVAEFEARTLVAGSYFDPATDTVATVTSVGTVTGNVSGSVGSLATQAKADVNAEVVDALNTDTYAEPGQGSPAATLSLAAKIGYLFKAWRNRSTQTATQYALYNDDATTVDQKATCSDDATTYDKGEVSTGP